MTAVTVRSNIHNYVTASFAKRLQPFPQGSGCWSEPAEEATCLPLLCPGQWAYAATVWLSSPVGMFLTERAFASGKLPAPDQARAHMAKRSA